ncbi:MAG: BlaI/MecI/CopY family transcriptional regulator [Bacteroidota bacterium]
MPSAKPSEAELEILQVLWQHQPCSIKVIHEQISQLRDVGYTTTQKQVQRMLDKGLITRTAGKGKNYNYSAAEPAAVTKGKLLDRMVKNVFGDSVSELMMHALGKSKVSKAEIEDLKKLLNQLDKDQ